MEIVFDISPFLQAAGQGPLSFFLFFLKNGGWIIYTLIIFALILKTARYFWYESRKAKYLRGMEFILLAIDVPKFNEQTTKAVEGIFSTLSGIQNTPNFKEKWWFGRHQELVSFEIISVDGYIQFLIHTPKQFRDLIESAIFAQYPQALITQVDDYVGSAPDYFPNDEYDLWGTEFVLAKDQAYPIRVYKEFEDTIKGGGEQELMIAKFKDPMSAMMEIMSKLRYGEQIWFQMILEASTDTWREKSKLVVAKLLGRKIKKKESLIVAELRASIIEIGQQIANLFFGVFENETEEKQTVNLSPGEKTIVEAIEAKASKIGFYTTLRFVYIAKHEVMNKPLAVNGFTGALKQFNTVDLNAFKPKKLVTTKINYFFIKQRLAQRKRIVMYRYKIRKKAATPFILNISELATLYHFPSASVRNTMIKTADLKRVGAPMSLPAEISPTQVEAIEELTLPVDFEENIVSKEKKEAMKNFESLPPTNLPISL